MGELAIKGHATRGKEVIEILEMLGGKSNGNIKGYNDDLYYYIAKDGLIYGSDIKYEEFACNYTIFTLEEFLEKYPYKIGDEVEYKLFSDANLKSKIIYMEWCNSLNKVLYTTEDAHVITTEDITETKSIPPYMDYDIKEGTKKNYPPKTQAEVDKYLQEHSVKNGMSVREISDDMEGKGNISDGYHTFNELYECRLLYNASMFNELAKQGLYDVHKSKKHSAGEECFGGGWFIVQAQLPTGQISNHYEMKDWDLFQIPEKEKANIWDGHTPQDVAKRLRDFLTHKTDI